MSVLIVLLFSLPGLIWLEAAIANESNMRWASERPLTTYERFLPLAVAGDPAIQHLLGYMFFYGEGVALDYEEAHYWFHQAAEEGDLRSQHNLGFFHSGAIARIPEKFHDASEANLWFSLAAANPENPVVSPLASQSYDKFLIPHAEEVVPAPDDKSLGEVIYQGSCAGCHGFDGLAAYPDTPSFSRGDRLEQSDRILVASILQGKGKMPPWNNSLSTEVAYKVVSYIRKTFGQGGGQQISNARPVAEPADDHVAPGEKIYLQFCGGCHGFNGIAWYVNSPSFVLRERLEKSDAELTNSIKNGLGAMPAWEHMLKPGQIEALVQFIRTLAQTYDEGISGELRRPKLFLRFRPKGETGANWAGDDFR